MKIRVECYEGYRGQERPRRLLFGRRQVAVVEIVDRWLDPEHRYFKVRGDDDGLYIICYDVPEDHWELTLFDRRSNRAG